MIGVSYNYNTQLHLTITLYNLHFVTEEDFNILNKIQSRKMIASWKQNTSVATTLKDATSSVGSGAIETTIAVDDQGFVIIPKEIENNYSVESNLENIIPREELQNDITAPDISVASKIKKRSFKPVPLPNFSHVLEPLLEGHMISQDDHRRLSSILKAELISFLEAMSSLHRLPYLDNVPVIPPGLDLMGNTRHENLITEGNSSNLRWQYRDLGETLLQKFPKMLWDLPGKRKTKLVSSKAPLYSVFIKRLSVRRKMKRLRRQKLSLHTESPPEIAVTEITEENAFNELTSVTTEAILNEINADRIDYLLRRSFRIRKGNEITELPPYLMVQRYLQTEVELQFELEFQEMVKILKEALNKMSLLYDVAGTIPAMEQLMQPKRGAWNAVTMVNYTSDATRPGPRIFWAENPCLTTGREGETISLRNDSCVEEAVILLLGLYFILNLNFPSCYGQFLGLIQNLVVKNVKFPKSFFFQSFNLCMQKYYALM